MFMHDLEICLRGLSQGFECLFFGIPLSGASWQRGDFSPPTTAGVLFNLCPENVGFHLHFLSSNLKVRVSVCVKYNLQQFSVAWG